jgi:polyisoprenoid-binding protein YceI
MRKRRGWLLAALLGGLVMPPALAASEAGPDRPLLFDTARSRLEFQVRTRLGQRLQGVFPVFDGVCEVLEDGRHQVRLRVSTAAAELPGKPRPTAWMRGEHFFDAVRHPWMEFRSEPYWPQALAEGGALRGRLSLRGVVRDEELQVLPARCARPGLDCAVAVGGTLERSRYGMDDWQIALGNEVQLRMEVWLKDNAGP